MEVHDQWVRHPRGKIFCRSWRHEKASQQAPDARAQRPCIDFIAQEASGYFPLAREP